jgi:hypothetical protein
MNCYLLDYDESPSVIYIDIVFFCTRFVAQFLVRSRPNDIVKYFTRFCFYFLWFFFVQFCLSRFTYLPPNCSTPAGNIYIHTILKHTTSDAIYYNNRYGHTYLYVVRSKGMYCYLIQSIAAPLSVVVTNREV